MSSNEHDKWYVYGYDRLGDFILILQHPKDQYKATSTDDVERATKFYDIRSAETCIKWINNGTMKFYDDTVNTEDLKVAYIDEYGNLYDLKTDICVFFNSEGYETEEDELEEAIQSKEQIMKLDEAKEILSKNGYNLLKESVEDDAEAVKKFIKYDDVTVYGDKIHNGIKSLIFVTDNEGHMFEDLEDAAESALIDASEAGLIDADYSYDDDGEDETGLWVKYTAAE